MAGIEDIIERLINDSTFRVEFQKDPKEALEGYDLSEEDLGLLAGRLSSDAGGEAKVEQRTSKAALFGIITDLVNQASTGGMEILGITWGGPTMAKDQDIIPLTPTNYISSGSKALDPSSEAGAVDMFTPRDPSSEAGAQVDYFTPRDPSAEAGGHVGPPEAPEPSDELLIKAESQSDAGSVDYIRADFNAGRQLESAATEAPSGDFTVGGEAEAVDMFTPRDPSSEAGAVDMFTPRDPSAEAGGQVGPPEAPETVEAAPNKIQSDESDATPPASTP